MKYAASILAHAPEYHTREDVKDTQAESEILENPNNSSTEIEVESEESIAMAKQVKKLLLLGLSQWHLSEKNFV